MSDSLTTFEEFVQTHSFHQTTLYYLTTPLDLSAHTQTTNTERSTEWTGTSGEVIARPVS